MIYNKLISSIDGKVKLTDDDKELISSFFKFKALRKKEFLLEEGDICKNLAFVSKGAQLQHLNQN